MLRTSLRKVSTYLQGYNDTTFLSSNAQDFIEERPVAEPSPCCAKFLSSNAQDFIEEQLIYLTNAEDLHS